MSRRCSAARTAARARFPTRSPTAARSRRAPVAEAFRACWRCRARARRRAKCSTCWRSRRSPSASAWTPRDLRALRGWLRRRRRALGPRCRASRAPGAPRARLHLGLGARPPAARPRQRRRRRHRRRRAVAAARRRRARVLDRLLHGLRAARDWQRALAGRMPPASGRARSRACSTICFAARARRSPTTARARAPARAVGALRRRGGAAGCDAPVAVAVVRAWLRGALAEADARAPFLTGGVTFGAHGADAAGAVQGDLPARHERRRVPAPRSRRRTQPARAPSSARAHAASATAPCATTTAACSCSCSPPRRRASTSATSARTRARQRARPSVVVAELLDAAAALHAADADGARGSALIVRHPLQPFSPAAFGGALASADRDDRAASASTRAGARRPMRDRGAAPTPVFAPRRCRAAARRRRRVLTLDRAAQRAVQPAAASCATAWACACRRTRKPRRHEPFGAHDALALTSCAQRCSQRGCARRRPDAAAAPRLLAERAVPPGRAGARWSRELLDELAPFAPRRSTVASPDAQRERATWRSTSAASLARQAGGVHRARPAASVQRAQGRTAAMRCGMGSTGWRVVVRLPVFETVQGDGRAHRARCGRARRSKPETRAPRWALVALATRTARAAAVPAEGGYAVRMPPSRMRTASRRPKRADAARANPRERSREGTIAWARMALRGPDPFVDATSTAQERFSEIADARSSAAARRAKPCAARTLA